MIKPVLFHCPEYTTDLASFGIDKPFALDRGELVLRQLREDFDEQTINGLVSIPEPITRSDVLLVHSTEYLDSLRRPEVWHDIFELKPSEYNPAMARFPLNDLYRDIALKSGGTREAVTAACQYGLAANLGGGYHHAFPEEGRGFCVLNDIAIAIRSAQQRGLVKSCLIVDVDFHQGDGTARIFRDDDSVFTLSIHSEEGWPEEKQKSDLDVGLFSHEMDLYQPKLETAVSQALSRFSPDLVVFVAGSDAYEKDVLPGTSFLKLTLDQMQRRDQWVIDLFAGMKTPLAMVFAGGYGPDVWEVHYLATRRIVEHSIISANSQN